MRRVAFLLLVGSFLFSACRGTGGFSSKRSSMMGEGGGEALSDVDHQMREAYERWSVACRQYNLPMTPAYDVVGLAAALGMKDLFEGKIDFFDREKTLEKATQLKLKNISPTEMSRIFSDESLARYREKFPSDLLIITDHGEETDDEVVLLLANKIQELGVNVSILFTTTHFEEEMAKYLQWTKEQNLNPIRNIYSRESFTRNATREVLFQGGLPRILQIGPIHNEARESDLELMVTFEKVLKKVPYEYYLLGLFGRTLNSQKDAEGASAFLHASARPVTPKDPSVRATYVVDTAGGAGAFKFTVGELAKVLGASSKGILDHAIKIAWRNTVGRANPVGGKFVAHLVAQTEEGIGANYQTVEGVWLSLQKILAENPGEEGASPQFKLTDELAGKAKDLARRYVEALKTKGANHLVVNEEDGSTNSIRGVTLDQITTGYFYILINLYTYFGVPIEFFESGMAEKWKPEWLYPGVDDKPAAEKAGVLFEVSL